MRVFSEINNCQQKQNKKQKQKTDKTKRGAPLLGLAKSIYYDQRSPFRAQNCLLPYLFHPLAQALEMLGDEKGEGKAKLDKGKSQN